MSAVSIELARRWLDAGTAAIVVEVVASKGSVPRGVGTRMLVGTAAIAGTIGGGHLELEAMTTARGMLREGASHVITKRFALGPTLGQCCGGAVELSFARLGADALARWPASEPRFRLQLHGAGHVGRAIATLLATIDGEVDWFDQRDDGFAETTTLGSPWPAHIRRTAVDTVEAEVAGARPGAFFLVTTHEHALDLRISEAILRRDDFGWFGLIGSKTKRASFERRLRDRGIDAGAIERMTCPIGIDGIGGNEPEVIAVAVMAQLLRVAETLTPTLSRQAGEGESTPSPACGRGPG